MADSVSSLDLATLHMASLDITQDEVAEIDTDTNGSASDRTKNANSVITAVEAVFNTTELLEHIIDYLHMRQMFAIQRVSRDWKDVVRTSPRVQARLRTYMFSNEVIHHRISIISAIHSQRKTLALSSIRFRCTQPDCNSILASNGLIRQTTT